jgi:hypothetical protein
MSERISPFSCGSQMGDWETKNCANCHLQGYYRDEQRNDWAWRCDIQKAIGESYIGDGTVSEDIARRMGAIDNETRYGWRCNELICIEPIERYAKRFERPMRRLCPIWKRASRALSAAWEFWIKPWDREDYDCYSGLRSPWLAWKVAWGIHDDDAEVVRCRSCKRPIMPEVSA